MSRVFLDTSVLIRYFAEDDPPRALAAVALIDADHELLVSTGVILETVHVLRAIHQLDNPHIGGLLVRFLSRTNVQVSDADKAGVQSALLWTLGSSARRIPDAIVLAAAEQARVDYVATFDEKMSAANVRVRML